MPTCNGGSGDQAGFRARQVSGFQGTCVPLFWKLGSRDERGFEGWGLVISWATGLHSVITTVAWMAFHGLLARVVYVMLRRKTLPRW